MKTARQQGREFASRPGRVRKGAAFMKLGEALQRIGHALWLEGVALGSADLPAKRRRARGGAR